MTTIKQKANETQQEYAKRVLNIKLKEPKAEKCFCLDCGATSKIVKKVYPLKNVCPICWSLDIEF